MFCHWRYVLDNLFGPVKSVSALGAIHIPERVDEQGEPYAVTAEDAAYAIFEIEDGPIVQMNSSWCVRVDRDELFELQVDGTHGSAVAGLRECRIQPAAGTPMPVWNPDIASPIDHRALWQRVPERQALRQRLQGPVGEVPAPRRARRAVPVGLPRGREGHPARRARHALVAGAALRRGAGARAVRALPAPARRRHASRTSRPARPRRTTPPPGPPRSRVCFAAAHVVADPLAPGDPDGPGAARLGGDARLPPPPVGARVPRRRGDGHRPARHGARLARHAGADPPQRRRGGGRRGRDRGRRGHRPPRCPAPRSTRCSPPTRSSARSWRARARR